MAQNNKTDDDISDDDQIMDYISRYIIQIIRYIIAPAISASIYTYSNTVKC